MKKIVALFLALLLLPMALACADEAKNPYGEFTIEIMVPYGGANPISEDQMIWQWITDATGITLDLTAIPNDGYKDKKSLMLSTNDLPDVLQIEDSDAAEFGRYGAFLDLTEYIEAGMMPNFVKAYENVQDFYGTLVEGHCYYTPQINFDFVPDGCGWIVRTDILEQNNIAIPTTFDELYDVLKQLKALYPDSYPLTAPSTFYLMTTMSLGFGGNWGMTYDPWAKQYVYGETTQGTKEAVAFVAKLYAEGLLDPDFSVNNTDMIREKLSTGKSFIIMNNMNYTDEYDGLVKASDPNAKFEMIPYLANADGEVRPYAFSPQWALYRGFAISASAENPERLVWFLDWLYSDEGMRVTNYGWEGYSYELVDGVPEFTDLVIDQGDKGASDKFKESVLGLTNDIFMSLISQRQWHANAHNYRDGVGYSRSMMLANVENIQYPMGSSPALTEDEQEQVVSLQAKLSTFADTENLRFLMNLRSMDEWDSYVADLEAAGAHELEAIYNNAMSR